MPHTKCGKQTVVVTGFGPFGEHHVNASWLCVQELAALGDINDDVTLVIEELPVQYDSVSKRVPQLWDIHQPHLMVHVGVSGIADGLTLEQQAHNDGYCRPDIKGRVPDNQYCVGSMGECVISAGVDMERVAHEIQPTDCGVGVCVSYDPGRYLCDFCYYTSLYHDRGRCAFIHVPPLNAPYSCTQLTQALRLAIRSILAQLN